jgi:hypothetical protein
VRRKGGEKSRKAKAAYLAKRHGINSLVAEILKKER